MVALCQSFSQLSSGGYTILGSNTDRPGLGAKTPIVTILILLLTLFNVFALGWQLSSLGFRRVPDDLARTDDLDIVYRRMWWNTDYSSSNRTKSDALWDAIIPSHGIISVDRKWAAKQHWPVSGYHPYDKTKGIYLLEAYHHLHCLRIIRRTFWEAVEGRPFTYHPGHHMNHCFDALRQSVQCNADNTPLYTFGDFTAGNGQLHQCRDWDRLRDWATQNTANYKDSVEGIPYKDHFGFTDHGDDGVGKIDLGAVQETLDDDTH